MTRPTRWLLTRYALFLPGIAAFLLALALFHQWEGTRAENRALSYAIAVGCVVNILMQFRFNDAFSLIDAGLTFFFGATGLLIFRLTEGGLNEAELDRIRALFVTALLYLLVGHPLWVWQRTRRRPRESDTDPVPAYDGYEGIDRRGPDPGRRWSDRKRGRM